MTSTTWCRSVFLIVNFNQISHSFLVLPLWLWTSNCRLGSLSWKKKKIESNHKNTILKSKTRYLEHVLIYWMICRHGTINLPNKSWNRILFHFPWHQILEHGIKFYPTICITGGTNGPNNTKKERGLKINQVIKSL